MRSKFKCIHLAMSSGLIAERTAMLLPGVDQTSCCVVSSTGLEQCHEFNKVVPTVGLVYFNKVWHDVLVAVVQKEQGIATCFWILYGCWVKQQSRSWTTEMFRRYNGDDATIRDHTKSQLFARFSFFMSESFYRLFLPVISGTVHRDFRNQAFDTAVFFYI